MASRTFTLNRAIFNPKLYASIRNIWFDGVPAGTVNPPQSVAERWFGLGSAEQKAAFDSTCQLTVHHALESIGPESYPLPPPPADFAEEQSQAPAIAQPFVAEVREAEPGHAHETALSLVLLLDQMPRNIFRKQQGLIYGHYDRIARSLMRQLLLAPELGEGAQPDRHPDYWGKMVYGNWFYLPFEHSEFLEDHDIYRESLLSAKSHLEKAKDEQGLKFMEMGLQFEHRHRVIIEQFGRYPYRNKALGRETTEEEKKWIEGGGDTFGA